MREFSELKGKYEVILKAHYLLGRKATRQADLLSEVKELLDDIYAEDIVSSGDLGKVYEKIAKELGDART